MTRIFSQDTFAAKSITPTGNMQPIPYDLAAKTREMMHRRPHFMKIKDVAESAGVTAGWLSKFMLQPRHDPAAGKLIRLHNYLLTVTK